MNGHPHMCSLATLGARRYDQGKQGQCCILGMLPYALSWRCKIGMEHRTEVQHLPHVHISMKHMVEVGQGRSIPVVVVVGLLEPGQGSIGIVQVLLVGSQGALSIAVPLQLSLQLDITSTPVSYSHRGRHQPNSWFSHCSSQQCTACWPLQLLRF